MRVKVEMCWSGNSNYSARCTVMSGIHAGVRIVIPVNEGEGWSRETAGRLRDHLEWAYGVKRNSVRVV